MTSDPIREFCTDMMGLGGGVKDLLDDLHHHAHRTHHTPFGMAEDAPATAAEDFTGIVANEGGSDAMYDYTDRGFWS